MFWHCRDDLIRLNSEPQKNQVQALRRSGRKAYSFRLPDSENPSQMRSAPPQKILPVISSAITKLTGGNFPHSSLDCFLHTDRFRIRGRCVVQINHTLYAVPPFSAIRFYAASTHLCLFQLCSFAQKGQGNFFSYVINLLVQQFFRCPQPCIGPAGV